MSEAATQYLPSDASIAPGSPTLAIADSKHTGGSSALPVSGDKVRKLLRAINEIDNLRNKLADLDGFPALPCETEQAVLDLTAFLSEALIWAATHGDTTGASRLPDAIIIDGERFDIVLHHDRGIYLSEFEGSPHGIMLEPCDSMNILGHFVSRAREEVKQRRESAKSRGETWPHPEPVSTGQFGNLPA